MTILLIGTAVKIKDQYGRTWRGLVTHQATNTEPIGAPGEQVPGPMSMTLTIEITRPPKELR